MIKIGNTTVKKQVNFWNHCLFHPTDAVEDPWGKRILDRMAADGSIKTVRLYAMLEDIVYLDENDQLCYDFRTSDCRLDYMVEMGYNILLSYATVPDCIATDTKNFTVGAKAKTRYKGKLFNTSPPKDYALYEEICYQYTKHIVERYGIERVSQWRCHCHNEPDLWFWLSYLPATEQEPRLQEYCKLYAAFEHGVRRYSDKVRIGGPACAFEYDFLHRFLLFVKENNLDIDYIALHNYGTTTAQVLSGERRITVENNLERQRKLIEAIESAGFGHIERIIDEWGAATDGYYNVEECPTYIFRENEIYSAYYTKLIYEMIRLDPKLTKMMICLSGQHEMVVDFSGFRNFFTLNFFKKPIYNAHVLASKLGEDLLEAETENENIFVVPTKTEKGYAALMTYASEYFEENIPNIEETITFAGDIADKTVTVWCIDKSTTNPYRLFQKMDVQDPENLTAEEIKQLREEGNLKPIKTQKGSEPLTLQLTPNGTYLITAE